MDCLWCIYSNTVYDNLPNSSSVTILETNPALRASSAVSGRPVSNIWADTFLGTHLTRGIPGVEQNIPTLPLHENILLKQLLEHWTDLGKLVISIHPPYIV